MATSQWFSRDDFGTYRTPQQQAQLDKRDNRRDRLFGTLTPAYGRDYKTGQQALEAWNEGKDFTINNPIMSTYCSIRDSEKEPVGHQLQIRWNHLTEVAIITKQADGSYAGNFEDEEEGDEL